MPDNKTAIETLKVRLSHVQSSIRNLKEGIQGSVNSIIDQGNSLRECEKIVRELELSISQLAPDERDAMFDTER